MTEPPPASVRWGMPYLQQRETPFRLTSSTRWNTASSISTMEPSSSGKIPALL